ncbi:hypothetical protein HispidOSU_019668 [Sigmodon hispidus]
MNPLQEANGTFALNLLKILGEDTSKNVFFSPTSISSALAMVCMGAKGSTASQMMQALSLDKCSGNGDGDVHRGFQSLLSEVNKTGTQYLLKTANRLFGDRTCDILAHWDLAYALRAKKKKEIQCVKVLRMRQRVHFSESLCVEQCTKFVDAR